MLGNEEVFQNTHAAEKANVLKGARNPRRRRDPEIGHAFQEIDAAVPALLILATGLRQRFHLVVAARRAAIEDDSSLGGPIEAGDAVEDRRLAGAIRADQGGDVAAPDIEGQVVDGDEAAEAHGEMLDGQDRIACPALCGARH